MDKHGWLLWTVLPLLIAAGIWWVTQPPRPDPSLSKLGFIGNERAGPVPTRAELAALQTQAENACRCARGPAPATGRAQPCWHDFDQAISRFSHYETASACVPLSTRLVCFGEGMDNCIVRDQGGGACTSEEAQTIDAIWAEAMREGGGSQRASARASRRIAEAARAFARGERVTARQTSGGCMG